MVAAEGDDTRQGFAVLGGPDLVSIGLGLAGEEGVVAFFDLVKGPGIVVSTMFNVSKF